MKRDMDLVRKILLVMEEHPHGLAPGIEVPGHSEEQIGYHCYLIIDGGLAEGSVKTYRGVASPVGTITKLNWVGHEFLDAARELNRWEKAKEIANRAGGVTLSIMTDLLIKLARDSVGL